VKPRVGISACLLGREVRYDGGHKRDRFLVDGLGPHVEWVPVCPELEIGLGVPRPAIRLESRAGELALVDPKSGAEHTAAMSAFAARRVRELEALELCGYVLKKGSPSCGLERVKVHGPRGGVTRTGTGIFAAALRAALPSLPVEEEGRLADMRLRESFLVRVFSAQRLRALFRPRWTLGQLVAFHTAHKLLVLAHSESAYRKLGRLVAGARALERAELRARYERELLAALAQPASTRRHVNVLQHALGHLRERATPVARAELAEVIDHYRRGLVPLVAPLTLLRHHVRAQGIAWLAEQVYLAPYPAELGFATERER
jgi:uncharacterized protein YbgA (DUF1722 family)/uncharacterized protein YbbK (DUF523 family)